MTSGHGIISDVSRLECQSHRNPGQDLLVLGSIMDMGLNKNQMTHAGNGSGPRFGGANCTSIEFLKTALSDSDCPAFLSHYARRHPGRSSLTTPITPVCFRPEMLLQCLSEYGNFTSDTLYIIALLRKIANHLTRALMHPNHAVHSLPPQRGHYRRLQPYTTLMQCSSRLKIFRSAVYKASRAALT